MADIHLDVPFSGIAADNEMVGRALADATFEAFGRMIDAAIEREVDFVVIAGDSFNSRDRSIRAERAFQKGMEQLDAAGIPVVMALGNHDPANSRPVSLRLPENVRVFSAREVERFEIPCAEGVCAVYGRSFERPDVAENLAVGFRRAPGDATAIGVLHTNATGSTQYDPYAPCSLDDLRAAGMDYWALGHIHKHEVLLDEPRVVYAGSLQGLNPKEIGSHGCCLVEMEDARVTSFEFIETAAIDWFTAMVDLTQAQDLDDVTIAIEDACADARTSGRPSVARLVLTGRTCVHGALRRPNAIQHLLDEVRCEQVERDPWVWVDRVSAKTASPLDLDAIAAGEDFAAVLVKLTEALSPQEMSDLVAEAAEPLSKVVRGYESPLDPEQAIMAARDACLELLLEKEGVE